MDLAAIARVKSACKRDDDAAVPSPDLSGLVRKTLLLNLGIALSALVIGVLQNAPEVAVFVVAGALTLFVWSVMMVASICLLTVANVRRLCRFLLGRRVARRPTAQAGLSDNWLDGTP